MVIDEQDHSDQGSDGSDMDAVSHFTAKFDEETGTEMAVSVFALSLFDNLNLRILKHIDAKSEFRTGFLLWPLYRSFQI